MLALVVGLGEIEPVECAGSVRAERAALAFSARGVALVVRVLRSHVVAVRATRPQNERL